MKFFINRLFLVILLSFTLNGCSGKVEDFTLLRFEQAKIFIYLPYRFDSYYRTKIYIKELSDDVVVDGDTVARMYEEKKVFHFKGEGVIIYGEAKIVFDHDNVYINDNLLGIKDNNYYYYILSPDGLYEEGSVREIW